ncbi:hypothetical protein [Streptomyces sp. NPDC055056]
MLNDLIDCLRIGDVTVFGKLDQESAALTVSDPRWTASLQRWVVPLPTWWSMLHTIWLGGCVPTAH